MTDIKAYCQFCLNIQTKEDLRMPITRKIKQDFFNLTRKKLNTTVYCEFICCQPCLEELESVISFRSKLLGNQLTLEKLQKDILTVEQSEIQEIKEDTTIQIIDNVKEDIDHPAEMDIEYLEEHIIEEENECQLIEPEKLDDTEEIFDDDMSSKRRKYPRKRLKEPIKCPKCDRLFYYKSYFAFHFKDVHEQQCSVCHHCGKVFKNSRRLNSHILIHNVGEKRFKCEQCAKEFNYSGDLLRHKRIHEQIKPYSCHIEGCGKSFVQSYALKLHLDVHNNVRFKCDRCASEFSVKTTLKNHMQKCINGISQYRASKSRKNNKEHVGSREKYKCFMDSCDREFSSRKYLGVHLEKHHHTKLDNFETTCLECQMVFDNVGDYAKHVKIHSCLFECNMCKLRFKTDEKLKSHIEKLHKEGDDRPFSCDDCGARFKRMEHLRGHQLYKHSNIKKFECTECPLKFRQRGEFNVHMRVHQDIKPFSCWMESCNHVCKTSSNLRQHMRLVHNGEINIYCCEICRATFKYNVDLNQHKKDHSNSTVYEIVEINAVN
ncbi:unnamed protein product [Chironomus riparius]|uniref:C2H2-type domain-containing protein n=1 Tax=Chironomus riparius TaxID=315576 RepID=A0A9N9S3F8_9DIPT|nr:unnamed protein product [Chironomus riparius]